MFKTGAEVMFQEPSSAARLLRRSTVIESDGGSFTVQFTEDPIPLEAERELLCYYEGEFEFMQQIVRVLEVIGEKPARTARLSRVGDPVSAESRVTSRVSTVSADILAGIGEERGLSVQDVSATGFAVIAKGSYPLGATFPISITFESDIYSGVASIQSIRALHAGRVRYGLRALSDGPEAGDLLDGLHHISSSVQRQQLKPNNEVG